MGLLMSKHFCLWSLIVAGNFSHPPYSAIFLEWSGGDRVGNILFGSQNLILKEKKRENSIMVFFFNQLGHPGQVFRLYEPKIIVD
jgi:hypothetical protein